MIRFKEVDLLSAEMKDCLDLDVIINKNEWPNSPASMMATPIIYSQMGNENTVKTLTIYEGETLIGITQWVYFTKETPPFPANSYRLRSVLIDLTYQNKGYEEKVLMALVTELMNKENSNVKSIYAVYQVENKQAQMLYEAVGFQESELTWEDNEDTDVIVELVI